MSEYIELDKVYEECQGDCLYCPFNRQNDSGDYCSLKELPSIEIIRCKDCKHWQPQEYGVVEVPFCKYLGEREEIGFDIKLGNPDDFCSYGERIDFEKGGIE